MTTRLYYNPSSAVSDTRTGLGYGKAQKTPSFGTGLGSETAMGWAETGIYKMPSSYEDYEDEFIEDIDDDEMELISKISSVTGRDRLAIDPQVGRRGSADRGSMVGLQRWDIGNLAEAENMPAVMSGIAPFSHRSLYPKGFSGPPFGTGGAGQAFRTTGPAKKTGTQYGSSRAPYNYLEDEDIPALSWDEIFNLDPAERSILRQRIRLLKLFNQIDETLYANSQNT